MAIRLASHLHKNRYGIFGFRIVIPKDLRLSLCRKEFRVSLRTTSRPQAKRIATKFAVVTDDYFQQMRNAPTFDEAVALGNEMLQMICNGNNSFDSITAHLETLLDGTGEKQGELLHRLISLRREQSRLNASKQLHLKQLAEKLAELPEATEDGEIDALMCDFYADVTPLVAQENALYTELSRLDMDTQRVSIEDFHRQNIEALAERQRAEIDTITDLAAEIAAKASAKAASSIQNATPAPPTPSSHSEPLSAIVTAYCKNQISEGAWTEKTEAENRAIYALWLRIVGDQPIIGYGFEQHRDYKAKLQRLPPNLNKSPRYRERNIDEVLALGDAPAAPNTINKSLTRVSALFEWAVKYGYTGLNPARGMTIANPKRANEERQAFTDDDITKLFGSPEYLQGLHKHPYQYWVPLIALYTGARLNEICQLHLFDLDVIEGVRAIRITEEGGRKRLKTKAARRIIPIHPELIRLGLVDYAESLRQSGTERLFPELKEGRDGYGRAASKWFASYASRCGVDAPGKVFHSFRHTFINQLKQAEVDPKKIKALVGHEDDSVTFGRYGKEFKVTILAEVIYSIHNATSELLPQITK